MKSLDGKVVMISGTAGGQGRAAAIAFAAAGAKVLGCDVKAAEAEETVNLVKKAGGEMRSMHPLDLADTANAEAWAKAADEAWGGIDVLYNNAASLRGRSPFGETTLAEWEDCIRFELTMVFISTKAVWPYLVKRGGGLVINTASISGHVETMPLHAPIHGVTKAGVMAFTRMLAAEGAAFNIRSVSISPGLIRSPTTQRFWSGETNQQTAVGAALTSKIPLQRPGEAEEIANVAVFLASPGASYINATDLRVDGGFTGVSYTRL